MSIKEEEQTRAMRVLKSKWSWGTLLIILIVVYIALRVLSAINSLNFALSPSKLPTYNKDLTGPVHLNPNGWTNSGATADWYHNASQGTATIPIPYSWLVALEAPKSRPWWIFFGKNGSFIEEYLPRVGFIAQADDNVNNPDKLPIGIARTSSIYFPGIDRKDEAAGFTCAACHTGQIVYGGTRYIVDGGPSMIDLGLFGQTLGAAVGQTALSSKFSLFGGRFTRFAKKVLGSNYNIQTKAKLKESLINTITQLSKSSDTIEVTEGFTRLDALNRIGNQVFNGAMDRPANYTPINAPVNFPHLWTTSWFDWVQYDGSIMQPLIRNTGEAIGVKAYLDTSGPKAQRFASSVNVNNLYKIEEWLGGTHPTEIDENTGKPRNKFNGLLAPKWPTSGISKAGFPKINKDSASRGSALYNKMCKGCHLPAIDTAEFWSSDHWKPISYFQNGEIQHTKETYLELKIKALSTIGTDPAQASVLGDRTVDVTGLKLNTDVCTLVSKDVVKEQAEKRGFDYEAVGNSGYGKGQKEVLSYVPFNDSATATFGLALGAIVERTNKQWFDQNYIPESERRVLEGKRPNCLQVGQGYKARPLNGVWATAPFLHNGSIATVYDLLSTQEERPVFVQLGSQVFDVEHLGIVQDKAIAKKYNGYLKNSQGYKLTDDYSKGLFMLDTRQPGNFNTGHLFDDKKVSGKIGRKLEKQEKLDIIEYLKTI